MSSSEGGVSRRFNRLAKKEDAEALLWKPLFEESADGCARKTREGVTEIAFRVPEDGLGHGGRRLPRPEDGLGHGGRRLPREVRASREHPQEARRLI